MHENRSSNSNVRGDSNASHDGGPNGEDVADDPGDLVVCCVGRHSIRSIGSSNTACVSNWCRDLLLLLSFSFVTNRIPFSFYLGKKTSSRCRQKSNSRSFVRSFESSCSSSVAEESLLRCCRSSRRRCFFDPRMDSPWTSGLTKPSAFLRYDGASLLPFESVNIELGDDDDDDDVFCARLFDRCLSLSLSHFSFSLTETRSSHFLTPRNRPTTSPTP